MHISLLKSPFKSTGQAARPMQMASAGSYFVAFGSSTAPATPSSTMALHTHVAGTNAASNAEALSDAAYPGVRSYGVATVLFIISTAFTDLERL